MQRIKNFPHLHEFPVHAEVTQSGRVLAEQSSEGWAGAALRKRRVRFQRCDFLHEDLMESDSTE